MKAKRLKSADKLKWKRVENDVEDEFNDDNGWFYGLEEIDGVGVDVAENGLINFVVRDPDTDDEPAGEEISGEVESTQEVADEAPQADGDLLRETKQKKKANVKAAVGPKAEKSAKAAAEQAADDFTDFSLLTGIDGDEDLPSKLNDWPELDPLINGALRSLKFIKPTPIQAESIPHALAGSDVIGKAATGSGKTLAYGVPILNAYLENKERGKIPQALIVAPTRELAHQIRDHMQALIERCGLGKETSGAVAITGGLAIQKQLRLLERKPVAIIGTPGRLLEVIQQLSPEEKRDYQKIVTLVLDEADRMVQTKSFAELDKILDIIGRGRQRQTLVFSATFEPDLWSHLDKQKKQRDKLDIREILREKLAMRKNAVFVDVDPKQAVAANVAQGIIECPAQEKDLYLYYFVLLYTGKTIVFMNSIDAVKRVVPLLKELGVEAFGVHSDMVQKQRLRALERFRDSVAGVLIATDVAARGLDVPEVDHVAHYHLPRTADMYVHRSGRTARAGLSGVAVMLLSPDESGALAKLRKLVNIRPQPIDVDFQLLEGVRPRVVLAKQIADAVASSAHEGKADSWLDKAAEDLGIDLSDDEREKLRSKPRKQKVDVRSLRAQLSKLMSKKIGPSRSYLTDGVQNMAQEMIKNPHALIPGKNAVSALETLGKKRAKPALAVSGKANASSKKIKRARPTA